MKHSYLALICGFLLVVILAISWCGRAPKPEFTGAPAPAQSRSPLASLTPTPSPSASPQLALASATPQTPSPELQKVASKVGPAVILISVFDSSGKLLRSGTGFFISEDGRFITNWHVVEGGAHAVAKSADGKIRNVTGVLTSSAQLDLALLKAETKTGVPFLPLRKASSVQTGTPVAVIGSSLARHEQPLAAATISARRPDQSGDHLEVSGSISNDAAGAPIVDVNGEIVGVVTSTREQGATTNVLRSVNALGSLLSEVKPGATGRWAAAAIEPASPQPSPSLQPPVKTVALNNRKSKLVYNPSPKYPVEARFSHFGPVKGSGRFRVIFSANGEAQDVKTVESTGNDILDQAALSALRQWKSEPGREWRILVPITFQP